MRVLILGLAAALAATAQSRYYTFSIDQDGLSGAPDYSWLNHALEASDRVFVRDGHFFRVGGDLKPFTDDDERVTLFGMNLAFGANFPETGDAERVARRLRKLGVNLVRLHHMDTAPDHDAAAAGSLLMAAPYPTLNGVAVERLRTFVKALAQQGIYCNLNLHVGYTFDPERDGVPPAGVGMPSQSKPLHIFYPRMVELLKEYAQSVVNALGLRDNPALAMVEINNESSLVDQWQRNRLDPWLGGNYRRVLAGMWNEYLARKYETSEALRAAWSGVEDGPELLGDPWTLEVHNPAKAVLEDAEGVATVRVTQGGAPVIVKRVGFSAAAGETYLAEVEVRADLGDGESRRVYWDVKQDVSPWKTAAGKTIEVTNGWQRFSLPVEPGFEMDGTGRFGLSVEAVNAPVQVRNATLHTAGQRGLGPGESLEDRTAALVTEKELATEARLNDWIEFLAATDRAYLDGMLAVVREAAGDRVPVAGTQMGYGGLMNLDSHASLDYYDNHFYVDHYNFPHAAWDGRDWRIRDLSSPATGLASFLNMAAARPGGHPYTVSEYNQPWPNTHSAEIGPALAVFGAFQDWDSIMHFAYAHGRNWDDGVPNGFNLNGDWTKFPGAGQSAWLFRSGAIRAGLEPVDIPAGGQLRLRATREKRNGDIAAFLSSAFGYDPAAALAHRVRLSLESADGLAESVKATEAPYQPDTGEFTFDKERQLFLVHADGAAGVFGPLPEGEAVEAGAIRVRRGESSRGYAAILVTPLDGRTIVESSRLLLSNPGYTLRSQPGARPAQPQQMVRYPDSEEWWTIQPEPSHASKPSGNLNGGQGPVWMERVHAFVRLKTTATKLTVYPLDGSGGRLEALDESRVVAAEGGFEIHLQADGDAWSPWYEIVRE
jgi:hypothetical protein